MNPMMRRASTFSSFMPMNMREASLTTSSPSALPRLIIIFVSSASDSALMPSPSLSTTASSEPDALNTAVFSPALTEVKTPVFVPAGGPPPPANAAGASDSNRNINNRATSAFFILNVIPPFISIAVIYAYFFFLASRPTNSSTLLANAPCRNEK